MHAAHPVEKDLRFLYVAMDPPPLMTGDPVNNRSWPWKVQYHVPIRSTSNVVYSRRSGELQQTLVTGEAPARGTTAVKEKQGSSNLLDVTRTRLSASCEGLELHPPAALRVRNSDWVAVLPVDFYDLWKDDIVSIFSSNSTLSSSDSTLDDLVEGDMERGEKLAVVRDRIPVSRFNETYPLLKAKVDTGVLQRCRSGAIQLVYFSRFKNCPQGYSEIIKVAV